MRGQMAPDQQLPENEMRIGKYVPKATKARFTTIHSCDAALGGVEYRATSDGKSVNLQTSEWGVNNRWKTVATISRARFDEYVSELGMDSPYGGRSPTHMRKIIMDAAEA